MPDETLSTGEEGFKLPTFDRPMDETPSPMDYRQAAQSMDEIIKAFRLQESEGSAREEILPFVM